MPGTTREGKMRAKLREAILAGFNPMALDEILHDNDMLRPNVAIGPDFATRVNSLIDVARQEGWLIELCGVLADARSGNETVSSAIVAVQKWLIDQRNTKQIDTQFQQDSDQPSKQTKTDAQHGPADQPIVTLTSIVTVDEEALDLAFEKFGTNWAAAVIGWPQSSDRLLSVIRDAVKKFDELNIEVEESESFTNLAPSAIAKCIRDRKRFQQLLPDLIHRIREFDNDNKRTAVVGYLLLSNFISHEKLAFLSSWKGLPKLGLQAPGSWAPFQFMRFDKAVLKLLARDKRLERHCKLIYARLYEIGAYNIDLDRPYFGICVPDSSFIAEPAPDPDLMPSPPLSTYDPRPPGLMPSRVVSQSEICRWLIPQIEVSVELRSLPETYSGDWCFENLSLVRYE